MTTQPHAFSSNGHHPDPVPTLSSLATEPTMTANYDTHPAYIPTNLEAAASLPDADPCDIAEAAMPDLILGDLDPSDERWVRHHTETCRYCRNILGSLEEVCSTLDTCNEYISSTSGSRVPEAATCLGVREARFGLMESPVGDVLVASSERGVLEISYLKSFDRKEALREIERRGFLVREYQSAVQPVIDQLSEYFGHQRTTFDMPVDLSGVTDFTRSVLNATAHIPYGNVQTYGDIAAAIGKPKASRAVGNALGRNRIPVIIPCHRVILASGAMGWYTGGPEIKRTLLGIEGVPANRGNIALQSELQLDA
jgi:O-6-methylguanine DNA methyltransferase